jgi:hypothetical protein
MIDYHPLIISVTVSLSSLNLSDTGILLNIVHSLELVIDRQCFCHQLKTETYPFGPEWMDLMVQRHRLSLSNAPICVPTNVML